MNYEKNECKLIRNLKIFTVINIFKKENFYLFLGKKITTYQHGIHLAELTDTKVRS